MLVRLLGLLESGASSDIGNKIDFEGSLDDIDAFSGCTIDTVIVCGNTRTKSSAILREMASKPATALDKKLIRRDAAYLHGLGYFASVVISAEPTEPGRCRLLVTIVERARLFMLYPYPVVNYDFDKGISYGISWKVKNFRGNAEDLSLSAMRRQEKEQGIGFSWRSPWFTGRRVQMRVDASAYQRLEEPVDSDEEYIEDSIIGNLILGLPITKSLVRQTWFRPVVGFERRRAWRNFPALEDRLRRASYRQDLILAGGELEYDSRTDRISPFEGAVFRMAIRRYTTVSGLNEDYIFYGAREYLYIPAGDNSSFIVALRGDVREGDLASFYEMKLGGVRDVRGYSEEAERGRVKLVGTLQYRARFLGPKIIRIPRIGVLDFALNWTAFVDSGALAQEILELDDADYHTTAGLGLEIISPFRDLIRVEVASDGTGKPAFYLTAGSDF